MIKLSGKITHTFFIHKTFGKKNDNPDIKYLPLLLAVIKIIRTRSCTCGSDHNKITRSRP